VSGLLAIGWEPELRGILIVIIAVGTLMGTVYLILATNLGARLGFLVTLAGLAGWMFLMGMIWAVYGIGLRGKEPSWQAVPGRTVLQDNDSLFNAGVFDGRIEIPADASPPEAAAVVAEEFVNEGWTTIGAEEPSFGQAASAAGVFLEDTGAFAAGEFQAVNVFDIGGDRFPLIGDFDLLAFWHEPHHVVVEVAALEPTRTEAGRAPAAAVVDETRQRQYVFMVRDLGTRRQPAFVLSVGAGLIFGALCWLLHRRERVLTTNRSTAPVPAG
jgi:hypothetical protein